MPGLAILEAALLQLSGDDVRRAELRFRGASFAGETIEVTVQQRRAVHGPCVLACRKRCLTSIILPASLVEELNEKKP